jgi:hypothetical protein
MPGIYSEELKGVLCRQWSAFWSISTQGLVVTRSAKSIDSKTCSAALLLLVRLIDFRDVFFGGAASSTSSTRDLFAGAVAFGCLTLFFEADLVARVRAAALG